MDKYLIAFLIGFFCGYYFYYVIKTYKSQIKKTETIEPKQLEEEIKEKNKTLELLDLAIEQKKEEKYNLVKQNIYLRHENQDLIDLRKTTEELQAKAKEDGMKIYIQEKEKMTMNAIISTDDKNF